MPANIAVLAVHGVGDQQPFDTVRAIGDLLQDLDCAPHQEPPSDPTQPVTPLYDPFTERNIRINVRPVVVSRDGAEEGAGAMRGPFHAWVRDHMKEAAVSQQPPDSDELALEFMRGQLRGCRGGDPEDTYETLRLEGTRRSGGASRTVHVYELYWADLSRLTAGLFRIFTELYQVLFHLSSLGTHTIDAEAVYHRTRVWRLLRDFQSWASVVLTVPVPILNLFMLGVTAIVAALVVLDTLAPGWQFVVAATAAGAATMGGVGVWWWRTRRPRWHVWVLPSFMWVAWAVAAFVVARRRCGGTDGVFLPGCEILPTTTRVITSAFLAAIVAWAISRVLAAYDTRRPGVLKWARWMVVVVAPLGVTAVVIRPSTMTPDLFVAGWIRQFEVQYALLYCIWTFFYLVAAVACVLGYLAVRGVDHSRRAVARRSVATARLTLSLPTFTFSVVTIIGWALLAGALKPLVTDLRFEPMLGFATASTTVTLLIDDLIHYSVGGVLPVMLAAAGLAMLPAIWGLAPVAWSELWPPDARKAADGQYSQRLGEWLDLTFKGLLTSTVVLYVATMFIVPILILTAVATAVTTQEGSLLTRYAGILATIQTLGTVSGVGVVWLFAVRGRLKSLALGFRPALDLLLDVDNWLREHPLDDNPRARICGRYVSLLRYLCNWRDPVTGRPYDGIVIIAHSQGTVVTADLLRYLRAEADAAGGKMAAYDPRLGRLGAEGPPTADPLGSSGQAGPLPIDLFTMGCPLRQLYGWRFPRLYGWARHEDDDPMDDWQAGDLDVPHRKAVPQPDPERLGVRGWVNAYRSGDYVGRFLWRTDRCGYVWRSDQGGSPLDDPKQHNSTDKRRRMEFCIGAGAHTHYWDRTGEPIARELDRLIQRAGY